jgi:trimeric autotransporter adhesin
MKKASLKINTSTGSFLIATNTIVRVEASSNYSKLFLANGKMLVTAKLLKWFDERLQPSSFTRLHRSHLVNNDFLQANQCINKLAMLKDGINIPIAKRRKKMVLQNLAAACLLFFVLSLNAVSQNVGVGTNTPAAKLHIKGSADTSQLFIDANSTQSSNQPLIKLRNSSGSDLLWIHSDNPFNTFVGLSAGRINNAGGGGTNNTFVGSGSGFSNTTGNNNTANGLGAMYSNTLGIGNTANGVNALTLNTTGDWNTANGFQALAFNSTGNNNTANGYFSLYSNVAGSNATAIGYHAMRYANNAATPFINNNVAVGYESLRGSITAASNTGNNNTAIGYQSLFSNSNGFGNIANGYRALYYNTTGDNNSAVGILALYNNTTGNNNIANGYTSLYFNVAGSNATAVGYRAMRNANSTAIPFTNYNVAVGYEALRGSESAANNTGNYNTATGAQALYANTTGNFNTANGFEALNTNTTGGANTAIGTSALSFNTTGSSNTAIGSGTLNYNVAGSNATAIGVNAMRNANTTATPFTNYNVALGYGALMGSGVLANNTGNYNTALGYQSLRDNSTGDNNTANGYNALLTNGTGTSNTANGYEALHDNSSGNSNTGAGLFALYFNQTGDFNTAFGRSAYFDNTNLNNTTCIGYNAGGNVEASNRVEIGNTSVTWIGGQVGWGTYSDARIKNNVNANVPGLSFINLLRPVTYNLNIQQQNKMVHAGKKEEGNWDSKYDIEKISMSGFIAQEVEKAAAESGYNFSGVQKPATNDGLYSLRYSDFVMPLVKAVQELNQKSDEQMKMIAELKKEIELLKKNK